MWGGVWVFGASNSGRSINIIEFYEIAKVLEKNLA